MKNTRNQMIKMSMEEVKNLLLKEPGLNRNEIRERLPDSNKETIAVNIHNLIRNKSIRVEREGSKSTYFVLED